MADYPLAELGGKTPLEAALTPHIDRLLAFGRVGTVRTIPAGMEPGSDVANMSLLGYNPSRYHTGRAPLEAASMGVRLGPSEVAFRCNLVTLQVDGEGVQRMFDYSAGHISSAEAHELVRSLQPLLQGTPLRLYPGISYRHLLVWTDGREDLKTTPPHDISGEPTEPYARVYYQSPMVLSFVQNAGEVLAQHPVNRDRIAAGKSPANAVWLWGQGRAPCMPTLQERYGIGGAMISAVDLLKGLGVHAGLDPIAVPGATGYLDTNYAGKVAAAVEALVKDDFVYVHIEAPDEAGHEGSLSKKIEAIEAFDAKVVGPMLEQLKRFPQVRLLIETDHPTPISRRTHVADPVPFLLVEDLHHGKPHGDVAATFGESLARSAGWHLASGEELFEYFMKGRAEG